MQNEKENAKPDERETSLAKISRELRDEFCWLASIGKDGAIPDPIVLTQHAKRNLVRSVFSFVEAMSFVMKANALRKIESSPVDWDQGELLLAQEISIGLTDAGKVVRKKAKIRTMSNVRFAFRLLAEAYGADFALNIHSNGWQCLQKAIKVRDRVTHPKCLSDLIVTDTEYVDAVRAFIWFDRQSLRIMEPIIKALDEELMRLRPEMMKLDPAAASKDSHISIRSLPEPPPGLHDDV